MTSQKEHLTYFKVENFKCFKSIELDDIGQFNLIMGDNNVGKTSMLEALLFNYNEVVDFEMFRKYLLLTLTENKNFKSISKSYIDYFINNSLTVNNRVRLNFETENSIPEKVIYEIPIHEGFVMINGEETGKVFPTQNNKPSFTVYLPLISFNKGYDKDLTEIYSNHIQISRTLKNELIETLEIIIPSIENIEISTTVADEPILVIVQKDSDSVLPLALFGEGMIKVFRILMTIVVHKGKRIMVDEIDAGIHHSRQKEFWKTIIKACIENDVQLFATTHNLECFQAYKLAIEEMKPNIQKNAKVFTLKKYEDGSTTAYNYGFEDFAHSLEHEIEIR
jgi:AAA15 family ATPase/GTPase